MLMLILHVSQVEKSDITKQYETLHWLVIVMTSAVWYKTRPGLAIATPGIISHMYRHVWRGAA